MPARRATVIEYEFFVVVIVVPEGQLDRFGISFDQTRRQGADDKSVSEEGCRDRRRKMITLRGHGSEVTYVESQHTAVALPADRVQWVERKGHSGQFIVAFDHQPPSAASRLALEGGVKAGPFENRWVEQRVSPQHASLRQSVGRLGRFDQQDLAAN